jgi:hypothetical protein
VTAARWMAAILYNGLGRYDEARKAARQAAAHPYGLYVSMRALPREPIWAAKVLTAGKARSGRSRKVV